MARFDFIEAAASAYRFVANEYSVIFRLALVPLAIKLLSFIFILSFGMTDNFLRQGLVLLPSFFAEGWLVAQLIRFAVYKERWPASLSGDQRKDMDLFLERSRCILSATIIYVLIKLVISMISGMVLMANETYAPATPEPATTQVYLMGMIVLAGMIWAFRLLWLYVPAALGYSTIGFLRRIKSYLSSFYMIGAWLLCFVPMALLLMILAEVTSAAFPAPPGGKMPLPYQYIMVCVQAVVEMLVAILSSLAIAFGVQSMFEGPKKRS